MLLQLEFILGSGIMSPKVFQPKSILKTSKSRSVSTSSSKVQVTEPSDNKVINLQQIASEEIKTENNYLKLQNQNLHEQLKELNENQAKDSQKFMTEFENQYIEMEKHFE